MRQRRLVWSFNLTRQLGNWNFNCGKSTTNVASKKRVDNETRLTYLGRGRANWAAKAAKNETRRSGRVVGRSKVVTQSGKKRDETLSSSRGPAAAAGPRRAKTRRDALVESSAAQRSLSTPSPPQTLAGSTGAIK